MADLDTRKRYIGDSVYVQFDGYHYVLTTENGLPYDPSNRICLEPSVYESLVKWVEALREFYASGKTRPEASGAIAISQED